jgi:hypothetical protein
MRQGGTELARVVPDEKHPAMWGVRSPDGRLSDMVNLTQAKDAAATMALRRCPNRCRDDTQKEKTKSALRVLPDSGRAPTGDRTTELQSRIPEALPGAEMARLAPETTDADTQKPLRDSVSQPPPANPSPSAESVREQTA